MTPFGFYNEFIFIYIFFTHFTQSSGESHFDLNTESQSRYPDPAALSAFFGTDGKKEAIFNLKSLSYKRQQMISSSVSWLFWQVCKLVSKLVRYELQEFSTRWNWACQLHSRPARSPNPELWWRETLRTLGPRLLPWHPGKKMETVFTCNSIAEHLTFKNLVSYCPTEMMKRNDS